MSDNEMYLKVSFLKKNKNKKIKINKSISIQQFKEKIKTAFPQLKNNYTAYYYNEEEDTQDISDFHQLHKFIFTEYRQKIYVKDEEDQYARHLNSSQESSKIYSEGHSRRNTEKLSEIKKQINLNSEHSNGDNVQNTDNILNSSMVGERQLSNRKGDEVHHKVDCKVCKSKTIIGIRWKSLTNLDYDLCSKCYQKLELSNKQENYLQIDTLDYFNKVNYYPTINKLFNPQYKEEPVTQQEIRKWISEEDILSLNSEVVRQIWEISEPLATKISSHFSQWIRQYQTISKR